jgi:hypothetical protein
MSEHPSSSFLKKMTSRRSFLKAAVLAPMVGTLGGVAVWAEPWLAHAQTLHTTALQQAQNQILVPRTEVFTFTNTGKLYHKFYFNGWSSWLNINPSDSITYHTSQPPVVAVVNQTIHLFALDAANNILWLNSPYNGSWSNWTILGRPDGYSRIYSLAVTTQGDGTLDLFALGYVSVPADVGSIDVPQDIIHSQWSNGQWSNWTILDTVGFPSGVTYREDAIGLWKDQIAVCSWGPGRLDVFTFAKGQATWHKVFDGQWHPWENLAGTTVSAPAAMTWGPGQMEVYQIGTDDAVWHKWYSNGQWSGGNGWDGWSNLSQPSLAPSWGLSASSWGPGRIDVYASSARPGSGIYHKWFDNGQWSNGLTTGDGWENLGLPAGASTINQPTSVSWQVPVQVTPTPTPTPTPVPRPPRCGPGTGRPCPLPP